MDEKKNSLKKWIFKNGYPFEMKVASLFQEKGFNLTQSILYKDNDLNKYRELDIIAYYGKLVNGVSFNFSFVIECKKSIDKPWLVFKNDNLINSKLNRFKPFATKNAELLIDNIGKSKDYELNYLFPETNNSGYNVVIAYKDKSDLAYSSSLSLLKACGYIRDKFNKSKLKQCNFYNPLIIIEGDLYDVRFNGSEEVDFDLVDSSSFMNTKILNDEDSSVITIASSKKLDKFIDELKKNIDFFFQKNEKDIEEISLSNPTSNSNVNKFKF